MARAAVHLAAGMLLLLMAGTIQAADGAIVNGSFEDNGYINDIAWMQPRGWSVSMPSGMFSKCAGSVSRDWRTDGMYSLTIRTEPSIGKARDMAVVSQDVVLSDVDRIVFDVKIATDFLPWDPTVCSAVVLIDGNVEWTSDGYGPEAAGEYLDQVCPIEARYRTSDAHTLSFGLRINNNVALMDSCYTYWDSIECVSSTPSCSGGGFPLGDFNADCLVDGDDLMMLAAMWLLGVPSDNEYNLSRYDDMDSDGVVNFFDLAVFSDRWRDDSFRREK